MSRTPSPAESPADRLAGIAREAMLERGLEPDIPPAALAQAEASRPAAPPAGAPDERTRLWCSIDNDDSRDLDQLSVAESLPDDRIRVHVAIADVEATVARGSPVDLHAVANTTSVYTPARIFPMLPERLSTDVTSLGPDVDRAAFVISYTVLPDGTVDQPEVRRAAVRNRAQLAYGGVGAWLEGQAAPPPALAAVDGLADNLRLQDVAAQRLRGRRHERGALDLESLETRAVVSDGEVVDLRREAKNRASALIEDFMIAANGVTARFLADRGFPGLRRIVRSPERWDRIEALARGLGEQLPPDPDGPALAAFLERRRAADPLRFPDLSLTVVKLLGRGEYVAFRPGQAEVGHFGLAVREYVHSTAPNRRYPDLITQRLLAAALAGRPAPYDDGELGGLAARCTEREDAADKVERRVRKSAAALLLVRRVGEAFDALVTGASDKGTWVRTLAPPVEGRLMRGERGLDVGDRVRVELAGVDVDRGFIDFVRAR